MSSLNQVKNEVKSYFTKTHKNKAEFFRFAFLALLAYYLTFIFSGSFNSFLGYDVRSEFSGYLVLLSFFSFLFIVHKHGSSHGLKLLSFCHVVLCITNFLIIKSLIAPFFLKLFVCYTVIFLLLVIIREIKNRS